MHRFLIADDHEVVRKGLKQILLDTFPYGLVEEVANSEDLLRKVTDQPWDLVITDISMPGKSGLEVLQQIKQIFPRLPVLVLSMHSEDQFAIRAIKAGASGYLSKDSFAKELIEAINQILSGKKYITVSIGEKLANTLMHGTEKLPHEYLSDREFQVFRLLAAGKSISDIAKQISLSPTSVSTYRSRIMSKMNLKTNTALTLYSIDHKLL
jgi:two-component system invasion response regulator UvrY